MLNILHIDSGEYPLSGSLDLSAYDGVHLAGDVVLDASGAGDPAAFTLGGAVAIHGPELIDLPAIADGTHKGWRRLEFAAAHGLSPGDRVCMSNPTDYSYVNLPGRPYYRAGEWVTVGDGGGPVAELDCPLYADYDPATIGVRLLPRKTFINTGPGNLYVKGPTGAGFAAVAAIYVSHIVDSDLSWLRPLDGEYAGMVWRRCLGVTGTGYDVRQFSSGSYGYGLAQLSCQDNLISGYFRGHRHGSTTGAPADSSVTPVNRNLDVRGTIENDPAAGVGVCAANWHGNAENCRYSGEFIGGFSGGGNHNRVEGRAIAHADGIAAYIAECTGGDMSLRGLRCEAPVGNPASVLRGVIDIDGNSTGGFGAHWITGGNLDFSGITIDAPESTRGVVINNRGYAGSDPVTISLRGARFNLLDDANTYSVRIRNLSGNKVASADIDGMEHGGQAAWNVTGVTAVEGTVACGSQP